MIALLFASSAWGAAPPATAPATHIPATAPTRIGLHYNKAPISEILADISRQSGVKFDLRANAKSAVASVAFDDQPFWIALDKVCRQSNLQITLVNGREARIVLERGRNLRISTIRQQVGQFLVTVDAILRSYTLDFRGDFSQDGQPRVFLKMSVYADPSIGLLRRNLYLKFIQIFDSKGNALISGPMPRWDDVTTFDWHWQYSMTLRWPAHPGDKIARLTGDADVELVPPDGSATAEIPNITRAGNVVLNLGGYRFELKKLQKKADGRYICQMEVSPDRTVTPSAAQIAGAGLFYRILDAEGHTIVAGQALGSTERTLPAAASAPDKLLLKVPLRFEPYPIHFDFRDIPLQ